MKHKAMQYFDIIYEVEEIWKPIPYYENDYEVSNFGRVRTTLTKTTFTKRHGERHWKQRILKYKTNNENTYKTGYRVDLWKNGKQKTFLVSRLVASAFIKDELFNKNMTINHIDGNRLNNKIENLEWCTLSENIKKGFETGLFKTQYIDVLDKKTLVKTRYSSLACASRKMGFNSGYLSNKIRKGQYDNENYFWSPVFDANNGIWEGL